jgi:hypothetical protein
MNESTDNLLRLEELFVLSLTCGLTAEEHAEFVTLRAENPSVDLQSFAEVIAALDEHHLAENDMQLPPRVRERIRAEALRILPAMESARTHLPQTRPPSRLPWVLSSVCAALMLVAIATAWTLWQGQRGEDPVTQRNRLLASAMDLIRVNWTDGPTPVPGVQGDIAWSTQDQRGYMRFQGMRVNDPTVEQYQLWIFDRNQDEKTPVDGGVFDIPSDAEVVVPIHAALRVREPYLFAVTIEKPGGVVVSDRSRLPLLAAVNP